MVNDKVFCFAATRTFLFVTVKYSSSFTVKMTLLAVIFSIPQAIVMVVVIPLLFCVVYPLSIFVVIAVARQITNVAQSFCHMRFFY